MNSLGVLFINIATEAISGFVAYTSQMDCRVKHFVLSLLLTSILPFSPEHLCPTLTSPYSSEISCAIFFQWIDSTFALKLPCFGIAHFSSGSVFRAQGLKSWMMMGSSPITQAHLVSAFCIRISSAWPFASFENELWSQESSIANIPPRSRQMPYFSFFILSLNIWQYAIPVSHLMAIYQITLSWESDLMDFNILNW